ncbi:MAG TPA: efflux RND transporter periplasmic adaptor subunit [Agriterribacter sp.]|nr:efflux RND transporter periplasmic adaptor subunit [Agriterribacter sp.]
MMNKTLMALGLFASLCATNCSSKKEKQEVVSRFAVTSPLTMDTSFTREYVSQIRSVRNIELRSQEKGFLQNIYVDEGQFVKAGQLMFRIMPKIYEAELMKAKAEVNAAEIEVQNTQVLADKNVVSKNELALANARLDQSRAELQLAQTHLDFTEIRAPFNGIIDRLPLKQGSLVEEGELLTTLSDNSQVFAYFNVSEPEYLDYMTAAKTGARKQVSLLMANNATFRYPGKIETIEGEFNNETGNISFRATFPNPERLLRHGQTAKVQMVVPFKNALIIPQKATYELQDKVYVFVVDGQNRAKSREITIGGQLPDLYLVSSGLAATDKILLEGVQRVRDDDKITYAFQDPVQVMSRLKLKAE